MQRLDDDIGIYQEEQPNQPQAVQAVQAVIAKPAFNPKANINLDIPEPVLEEEVLEDLEEDSKDEVEEESTETLQPLLEKEIEDIFENLDEEESEVVEELPLPDTISTPHGFEIRLPAGKLDAIIKSIESTPHEGYKPIVGLNENGQIVIDWVSV